MTLTYSTHGRAGRRRIRRLHRTLQSNHTIRGRRERVEFGADGCHNTSLSLQREILSMASSIGFVGHPRQGGWRTGLTRQGGVCSNLENDKPCQQLNCLWWGKPWEVRQGHRGWLGISPLRSNCNQSLVVTLVAKQPRFGHRRIQIGITVR